jgi:hypothetical protein
MWLTDPDTGKKSVTVTLLIWGFLICTTRLLLSDIKIGIIHLGAFSGSDFALAVGAVGAIYAARKHSDNLKPNQTKNED